MWTAANGIAKHRTQTKQLSKNLSVPQACEEMSPPQLPTEIFHQIIHSSLPFSTIGTTPIAFPASDPIVKTLLSLTRTCQATHELASKYLYTFGIYIDDLERVYKLLATLSSESGMKHATNITSMFLAINECPVAPAGITDVTSLLKILAPRLTRLIMDQPSSLTLLPHEICRPYGYKLTPVDDAYFEVFRLLENLEVFVNFNDNFDDLALVTDVWTNYHKLRVLGMESRPAHDTDSWEHLSRLKKLETLIFLNENLNECFLEDDWKNSRPLNVVLLTYNMEERPQELVTDNWRISEKNKNIMIRDVWIAMSWDEEDTLDYDPYEAHSQWVKSRLMKGEDCITS